jgi:hypothetical protein
LARQLRIVEKSQGNDVCDIDALGGGADGQFNGFVHVVVFLLLNFSIGLRRSVYHKDPPLRSRNET